MNFDLISISDIYNANQTKIQNTADLQNSAWFMLFSIQSSNFALYSSETAVKLKCHASSSSLFPQFCVSKQHEFENKNTQLQYMAA